MTGAGRVALWVVLGASLLANAVALGLVLRMGALRDLAGGLGSGNGGAIGEGIGGGGGWSDLPAETRSAFRAELVANRTDLGALLLDLRQARTAMFAAAAARPFDRTAVAAAQDRVRAASAALQVRTQALMLEAFEKAAEAAP